MQIYFSYLYRKKLLNPKGDFYVKNCIEVPFGDLGATTNNQMNNINQLILGDNLEILKNLPADSIDLIYLDPPFFSNRNYEIIWGDKGEVRSFEDRFSGGIDHYIGWLKERVIEMHRILKPTGSIFLHCDWHADAYIRVQILDKIFGYNNLVSSIYWKRRTNTIKAITKSFTYLTDTIYHYSKTSKYTFNILYTNYPEEYYKRFKYQDENGFYRWQVMATYSDERYQKLKDEGKLRHSENAKYPEFKQYLEELKGLPIENTWQDIDMINSQYKERIGYPTQKPQALLHRIIQCASNEGDIVLDPFVGGGTTVAVADMLGRNWIGIDQSVAAVKVTEMRMQNVQGLFSKPFVLQLHKYDYDTLRYKDAFEFETFIVQQYGGISNAKQRGDFGLDGKTRDNTPIQVKRSDQIGRNVIDNFKSACERNDKNIYEKNKAEAKPVGFIIAFSFGKGAVQEVARLQNEENVIIKLVLVEDIVPIAKKPTILVNMTDKGNDNKNLREILFSATATSASGNVEFFAWDFEYKDKKFNPQILIDKVGLQSYKFKAGLHEIAVKVVDSEGLESIEVIKLKVNGKIEKLD